MLTPGLAPVCRRSLVFCSSTRPLACPGDGSVAESGSGRSVVQQATDLGPEGPRQQSPPRVSPSGNRRRWNSPTRGAVRGSRSPSRVRRGPDHQPAQELGEHLVDQLQRTGDHVGLRSAAAQQVRGVSRVSVTIERNRCTKIQMRSLHGDSRLTTDTITEMAMSCEFVRLKSASLSLVGGFGELHSHLNVSVKVKSVAHSKDVQIHYRRQYDSVWQDEPLTWKGNFGNYDVFALEPALEFDVTPFVEFAIRFVAGGTTYWDNNSFANYSLGSIRGCLDGRQRYLELRQSCFRWRAGFILCHGDCRRDSCQQHLLS